MSGDLISQIFMHYIIHSSKISAAAYAALYQSFYQFMHYYHNLIWFPSDETAVHTDLFLMLKVTCGRLATKPENKNKIAEREGFYTQMRCNPEVCGLFFLWGEVKVVLLTWKR
jgi:hypothetical protein